MNAILSKLSIAVALGLSINAHALPTLYPLNVTLLSQIENKTNSNLVADNADPKVIYVMPPNKAFSYVEGLHTLSANLGFCREIRDLQGYGRNITARIAALAEKEEERFQVYESKRQIVTEAKLKMAQFVVENNLQEVSELEEAISENQRLITEVTEKMNTCEQSCDSLKEEFKDLRSLRKELNERKRVLQDSHRGKYEKYARQLSKVKALEADLQASQEDWDNLSSSLMKLRNDFQGMYKNYGELEGAYAAVQFSSNWDQNIEDLRATNPGFDFKKIPTENAVITSNILDLKNVPSSAAILGYMIGGEYQDGHMKLPSYPENLSGNVRLSLLGACPVLHPDYFDINLPTGTDKMRYGLTVAYEFPSAFTTRVKINYNMYKLYKKVVSSGSRGGFFSRKSWTSVEERTFFKDGFSVDWLEQDASNRLTEVEKADMEREMRNSIFARLAAIGLPAAANAGQLVLPPVSPSGAIVLSNGLKKHCPGNKYCVIGSVALDVLDSIFGSSKASASYTNIQEAWLSDEWSSTIVTNKPWVTTYN